ncbi:bifunctional aspartate kinase/homoserine dehydrogenase I [Membranihabitans maritimus]|uniref:bifunctional aspartate kinase/homoserine dehydrogenase I n=1 Tax=Membranihabitans maritimus TaxID=2904244 RepID=UPI001F00BF5F|nr:bifunctional aspartate kinase/homoserine dehydrogenase I [Membranihabitans maritimus]
MRVLKFGGSSVGSAERIRNVGSILKSYADKGIEFTVVFSAIGGITDLLISMADKASKGNADYKSELDLFLKKHNEVVDSLFDGKSKENVSAVINKNNETLENLLYGIYLVWEASPRTMDYVLSFGERNSAFIISKYLENLDIDSEFLDARKIIKTNKNFGSAQVNLKLTYKNIKEYYTKHKKTQIVTGFIASAKGGLSTTLGRGGSDYTAALLGAGLQSDIIEIWTDVDGVLTSDPRRVNQAFTIPKMSFMEAVEMSHFGAKVIYAPTMQPAMDKNIPLVIKNTFNPDHEGTFISSETNYTDYPVKGISSINNVALLTLQGNGMVGVPGTAARLFRCLADSSINIIMITQGSSEYSISFAILPFQIKKAIKAIKKEFKSEFDRKDLDHLHIEEDLSILAIIGDNMRFTPGVAAKMMRSLGNNGINIVAIAQGSSERNISVVVSRGDENKALNALHEGFFLSNLKVINLFVVGSGLIGSTLLKQISDQNILLRKERGLEIRVVGLANSKKMIFDEQGIDIGKWKDLLSESNLKMDMHAFSDKMNEMNLINSVFVDNTATKEISIHYDKILKNSIHIVTPNKIATSSSYDEYSDLKTIARKNNVTFGFETNVGAGLPVISTLQNLIHSGDKITKIEGVLSGSLSYIFNEFVGDKKFSDVVKEAQKLGFTEPDPRVDLSGTDVKRKILILSREAGMRIEPESVRVEDIVPQECMEAENIDSFFRILSEKDDYFEKLKEKNISNNKRLRVIATMENQNVYISLKEVSESSPFFNLEGSDNMIVFTTNRYDKRPLVVRGPGAGAEVTAAGVFAEIINIESQISPS